MALGWGGEDERDVLQTNMGFALGGLSAPRAQPG